MANRNLFSQITIPHVPTLMLIIGYPAYWLSLFFNTEVQGYTSNIVWWIWGVLSFYICWRQRKVIIDLVVGHINNAQKGVLFERSCVWFYSAFMLIMLLWLFFASSYPLHLPQEFDALNYHYTLPRQHLIQGSFSHLPWSTADLFLMPIQYALSPFWFSTELLNKWPQYIFLVGLLSMIYTLVLSMWQHRLKALWAVIATLSTHAVMVQGGTAMLDLTITYLFFATIHSFIKGRWGLFAVESAFFVFAKPLLPIQMLLLSGALVITYFIFHKKLAWSLEHSFDFFWKSGSITSFPKYLWFWIGLIVGGPFMLKSFWFAGTPLYPLGMGTLTINPSIDVGSSYWQAMIVTTKDLLAAGNDFGEGSSLWHWIKHWWILAVPTKGVNNSFDYPLGLTYLLFIGPFLMAFIRSLFQKKFSLAAWFIVFYWATWWFSTQQSRFLYIPIIGIYVIMIHQKIFKSRVFHVGLMLACCLTLISSVRSHQHIIGQSRQEVLRATDKNLMALSERQPPNATIFVNHADIAYLTRKGWPIKGDKVFVVGTQDLIMK